MGFAWIFELVMRGIYFTLLYFYFISSLKRETGEVYRRFIEGFIEGL